MYLTKTFDINGGFGKYRSSHQIMSKQIRKLEVLLILLVSTVTLPAQVSTDDSTSLAKDFAL